MMTMSRNSMGASPLEGRQEHMPCLGLGFTVQGFRVFGVQGLGFKA